MRIRQGNDFIFLWAIERNELPEDFSNAVNIRLHFKNFDCIGEVKSFQIVDGNIVRVEVSPEWASQLGAYRLILSYEFEDSSLSDGDRKCVVDVLAFNIVPKTSEADDVTEMAKTTDIMIGLKGDKGDAFTYDDFTPEQIEDLKRPAIEAAESVLIVENQISINEQGRVQAESLRATAESSRESAESLRIEAELLRQSSTQEAISDAENATENANTSAQNADDARLAIQDDLALKADQADLVQLAGDVNLFKEESNLKDATQDSKIKDIESIISAMNPNQSAQLSVSGVSPLSLPKNAANGGMSVKLEGQSAENLVTGGKLIIATSYAHNSGIKIDVINGNKYYGKRLYQTISGTDGSVTGRIVTLNPTHEFVRASESSRVFTYSEATEIQKNLYMYGPQGGTVLNGEFSDVMIINLTATFGSGNEPTKEQCDLMFANYFEGVKSFEPTGRVRSVGKNLLDFDYWKNISNYMIPATGGYRAGSWQLKPNTTYTFRVTLKGAEKPTSYFQVSGGDGARWGMSGPIYAYPSVKSSTTGSDGILMLYASGAQSGLTSQFELTNFMLVEGGIAAPYEPYKETNFYLTAPELRSNGLVKDEIRKGSNGYELVKRVGVGSLGANGIAGGDFEGGLIGIKGMTDEVSSWSINNISPISGTQDGKLTVTTVGTNGQRPIVSISLTRSVGQYRRLSFDYKVNSGIPILGAVHIGGGIVYTFKTFSGIGKYTLDYISTGTSGLQLIFDGRNLFDCQIDNIKDELINVTDGATLGGSATKLSDGTILYTLATPVITPIAHGGILNSAENGTVYHEPIIADAGVYDTKMDILLTDYPIASIEEIIKYEDGIDTYLNVESAVIAGDGLSFTHPDLADGDLVLFTYAFDKESTNGNITATFYDSNVVKIDTATGKAYKIEEVVTNGELTRTLTEV